MSNETVLTGKSFTTFLVLIKLFSTMDFAVGTEVLPSAEGFPTFSAGLRPFSTVNSVMYNYDPVSEKKMYYINCTRKTFFQCGFSYGYIEAVSG